MKKNQREIHREKDSCVLHSMKLFQERQMLYSKAWRKGSAPEEHLEVTKSILITQDPHNQLLTIRKIETSTKCKLVVAKQME